MSVELKALKSPKANDDTAAAKNSHGDQECSPPQQQPGSAIKGQVGEMVSPVESDPDQSPERQTPSFEDVAKVNCSCVVAL